MKRVKIVKKKCPNPLFEKWLLEWKAAAEEQASELRHTYGRALTSLKKYPLKLKSGKECIIMENFGAKICQMLDKKLEEYKKGMTEEEWNELVNEGELSSASTLSSEADFPERSAIGSKPGAAVCQQDAAAITPRKGAKKNLKKTGPSGMYVPKYRSGAYAILIALAEHDGLTKANLIRNAQKYCDGSFTKAASAGSFYTAWASMASLIKKELVIKEGKPACFKLTDSGRAFAARLNSLTVEELNIFAADTPPLSPVSGAVHTLTQPPTVCPLRLESTAPASSQNNSQSNSDGSIGSTESYSFPSSRSQVSKSDAGTSTQSYSYGTCNTKPIQTSNSQSSNANGSSQTSEESHETLFLLPSQFKIILLVDIHETEMQGKKRTDGILQMLLASGVVAETRHLAVGDFVWIARDRAGVELTLPYVVERKRLDDLAASIRDGRFHEQKFRLKGCGVPNIIYLVEKYGKDPQRLSLPLSTVQQAAANTQVVDEFMLKISQNLEDSMRYLTCFTRQLIRIFKDKTLMSCPKSSLPQNNSGDIMSLMTFKQFNKDSVKIKHWTVKEMLIKQLLQMSGLSVDKATAIAERFPTPAALIAALTEGNEKMLADLPCSAMKKVGPVVAKAVYLLYTQHDLP